MAHSKNITWVDVEKTVERHSRTMIQDIALGEEAYQDLLEAFQANGGTDQLFANALFGVTNAAADQVAMVADAKQAMISIHNLYQALHNTAVTTKDRAADLYRMS